MVIFEFKCVFVTIIVKDMPTNHAFASNFIDAREISNFSRAGGVRNEVLPAGADATGCTCVHDERWCGGDSAGNRGELEMSEDCCCRH